MGPALPVVKLAVSALAGIPVSKIVNDIIRNNVTIVTKVDKVKVVSGSVVIGAMISQSISRTTDQLVDAVVNLKRQAENPQETTDSEVN